MRDHLLGYLIEALEPSERDEVEDYLSRHPDLRVELERLDCCLEPLRAGKFHHDPPPRLVERTCEFVALQRGVSRGPAVESSPPRSRWTLADLAVAAGIFIAAAMLFFPAVNHSRYAARLAQCQNNLRHLGLSLAAYSERHDRSFPEVPLRGNLSAAGVYAAKLLDNQYLEDPAFVVCPASHAAEDVEQFKIPTIAQLRAATGADLAKLQRTMGGSYGYTLGYVDNGRYRTTRNLHREHFAIMADAPDLTACNRLSRNHGGCGQNVLFEDGHVAYLNTCKANAADDIFVNDQGQVAAGLHRDDSVIGHSSAKPVVLPLLADDE